MEAEKLRCERARSIVQWLIKNGYATNQKCLAKLLGYNHAALSQILNGKVPMSGKFMNTLCSKNSALNRDWLETGEGEMFVAEQERSESDQIRAIIDGNEISGNFLVNILSSQSQLISQLTNYVRSLSIKIDEQQKQIDDLVEKLNNKG